MSYNKNTMICSQIDCIIRVLKDLKVKYKLTVIGKAEGNGLNDDLIINGEESSKIYPLRKLEYKNKVILERIERHSDCDFDDFIISKEFKKTEIPKKWKLEINIRDD